eukprot:Clim_evm55s55 gene=Clim_evmTU55s55
MSNGGQPPPRNVGADPSQDPNLGSNRDPNIGFNAPGIDRQRAFFSASVLDPYKQYGNEISAGQGGFPTTLGGYRPGLNPQQSPIQQQQYGQFGDPSWQGLPQQPAGFPPLHFGHENPQSTAAGQQGFSALQGTFDTQWDNLVGSVGQPAYGGAGFGYQEFSMAGPPPGPPSGPPQAEPGTRAHPQPEFMSQTPNPMLQSAQSQLNADFTQLASSLPSPNRTLGKSFGLSDFNPVKMSSPVQLGALGKTSPLFPPSQQPGLGLESVEPSFTLDSSSLPPEQPDKSQDTSLEGDLFKQFGELLPVKSPAKEEPPLDTIRAKMFKFEFGPHQDIKFSRSSRMARAKASRNATGIVRMAQDKGPGIEIDQCIFWALVYSSKRRKELPRPSNSNLVTARTLAWAFVYNVALIRPNPHSIELDIRLYVELGYFLAATGYLRAIIGDNEELTQDDLTLLRRRYVLDLYAMLKYILANGGFTAFRVKSKWQKMLEDFMVNQPIKDGDWQLIELWGNGILKPFWFWLSAKNPVRGDSLDRRDGETGEEDTKPEKIEDPPELSEPEEDDEGPIKKARLDLLGAATTGDVNGIDVHDLPLELAPAECIRRERTRAVDFSSVPIRDIVLSLKSDLFVESGQALDVLAMSLSDPEVRTKGHFDVASVIFHLLRHYAAYALLWEPYEVEGQQLFKDFSRAQELAKQLRKDLPPANTSADILRDRLIIIISQLEYATRKTAQRIKLVTNRWAMAVVTHSLLVLGPTHGPAARFSRQICVNLAPSILNEDKMIRHYLQSITKKFAEMFTMEKYRDIIFCNRHANRDEVKDVTDIVKFLSEASLHGVIGSLWSTSQQDQILAKDVLNSVIALLNHEDEAWSEWALLTLYNEIDAGELGFAPTSQLNRIRSFVAQHKGHGVALVRRATELHGGPRWIIRALDCILTLLDSDSQRLWGEISARLSAVTTLLALPDEEIHERVARISLVLASE